MKASHLVAAASVLLAPYSAIAHHSFAMFDQSKTTEIQGTVMDFQWTNPHAWLDVSVTDESGKQIVWGVEMNGPSSLYRNGWRQDSVKAGDKVSVTIHPLRDGRSGGSLVSATLPSGVTLVQRAPGPPPGGTPETPAPGSTP